METLTKGNNLTVTVDNFNVSYDDFGEGAIPLIFLHGYPFDKKMWNYQLEFFKSSYRVIAYDIRGFGRSIDEDSTLSIDLFSEDLIKFMDVMRIEKAVICGLSMGGYIALNAHQKFPDRFEALVLCDTQCIADTAESKEKRHKSMKDIATNGVENFNDEFIKHVFHKDSFTNKKEVVEQIKSVVFSNTQHIISHGLEVLAERAESCSTLWKVQIPTLIMCGREDEVTPLAQSEYMHQYIEGSVLQVIENAGHLSNLEQPHEFNKHLGDFLSKLEDLHVKELSEKEADVK